MGSTVLTLFLIYQSCFDSFIAEFKSASLDNPSRINQELVVCSLGQDLITESYNSTSALHLFDIQDHVITLTEINLTMGGYSSNYLLSLFSDSGELLRNEYIGSNALRNSGGWQSTISFVNDTLLQVLKEEVEYDADDNEKILKSEYSYYVIGKEDFRKISNPKYSGSRKYPQVTFRVLNMDELSDYSKEELDIMRNEIFADHGYRFKTEKWQDYFVKQPWYEPRFDDVNDRLSIIEKVNIQKILEVSRLKQ